MTRLERAASRSRTVRSTKLTHNAPSFLINKKNVNKWQVFLLVGMTRFERAASRSRTVRSSQTELHPVDKLHYAINSFISQVIISPLTNSPAACQKNVNFFKISFFRFFSATNLLMVALVFKYAKTFHYLYITGSLKSIFSQVNFPFFCISLQPRFLFHKNRSVDTPGFIRGRKRCL